MNLRSRVYTWLARKANIQTTLDQAERDAYFESGIRVGIALVTEKPTHGAYRHYGQMIAEHASDAMERIKLARISEPEDSAPTKSIRQRAQEREITAVMAVPTSALLPLESVIGPVSTQSLPAVDPTTGYYLDHRLLGKARRWSHEQRQSG